MGTIDCVSPKILQNVQELVDGVWRPCGVPDYANPLSNLAAKRSYQHVLSPVCTGLQAMHRAGVPKSTLALTRESFFIMWDFFAQFPPPPWQTSYHGGKKKNNSSMQLRTTGTLESCT